MSGARAGRRASERTPATPREEATLTATTTAIRVRLRLLEHVTSVFSSREVLLFLRWPDSGVLYKSPFIITITTSRVKWHDTSHMMSREKDLQTREKCVVVFLLLFLIILRNVCVFTFLHIIHVWKTPGAFTYDEHFTYDTQNATCEKHRNAWNDVEFQTLKHMTYDFR